MRATPCNGLLTAGASCISRQADNSSWSTRSTRAGGRRRLPGLPATDMFAISPDNRTIYYGARRAEADIWIVERK